MIKLIRPNRLPQMPIDAWPSADRTAFLQRHAPDIFSIDGIDAPGRKPSAQWSKAYTQNLTKGYGKWLSHVFRTDPTALREPFAGRITRERLAAYLTTLESEQIASTTRAAYISSLLSCARHLEPQADWTWLSIVANRLRQTATPARSKQAQVVRSDELVRCGLAIMQSVPKLEAQGAALRYRNGLILALWSARPWRLSNFWSLTLSRHLKAKSHFGVVQFSAEEMKGQRDEGRWILPDALLPFIRSYVYVHRPRLVSLGSGTDALWVSQRGEQLSSSQLATVLGNVTLEFFGVRIHPHGMRYSAATTIALSGGESARTTMSVLGHADLRTAEQYYNQARMIDAQRLTTESLTELVTNDDIESKN